MSQSFSENNFQREIISAMLKVDEIEKKIDQYLAKQSDNLHSTLYFELCYRLMKNREDLDLKFWHLLQVEEKNTLNEYYWALLFMTEIADKMSDRTEEIFSDVPVEKVRDLEDLLEEKFGTFCPSKKVLSDEQLEELKNNL